MNSVDNSELANRIQDFLESIEHLLDRDWDYTKCSISGGDLIQEDGTFLNPLLGQRFTGGEGDNWSSRSSFLAAYRDLRSFAISEGLYVAEVSRCQP